MSVPMKRTKRAAQLMFGKYADLVRVYVPKSAGFLQAPNGGIFWVPRTLARQYKLKRR
jgi:hypothetical protein